MKVALIGYGKMGQQIEQICKERGHTISCIIDLNNKTDFDSEKFKSVDVAIEFTTPQSALDNYKKCFEHNIPIVSGTTGWIERMDYVKEACEKEGKTFFYASNYSLGVNLFFALNEHLAKMMRNYPDYHVKMEETHHIHKLDAPSGTAITLADGIMENIPSYKDWNIDNPTKESDIYINCVREGEVPGIHEVTYESTEDTISIKHDAKSRRGFALGAVLAAEFTAENKGFLGMKDLLKL